MKNFYAFFPISVRRFSKDVKQAWGEDKHSRLFRAVIWCWVIPLFLFAGVLGHDPWKQDETYSFGIIYHFYASHSWLVPINAGMAFMEKPPLYYWTAAMLCKWLAAFLPLPDAARTASVFYMAVALCFVMKTAFLLSRQFLNVRDAKEGQWIAALLFLGTVGVIRHAHDMFTDVALLAGTTVALYGMALWACRPGQGRAAGLFYGVGIGIAFLAKGFFIPVMLALTALVMLCYSPSLRNRGSLIALLCALLAAAPFLLLWPLLLYRHSPELFRQWFWDNNIGRFLGFSVARLGADNKPFFILYSALWFAFPVLPLAVAAILPAWRGLRRQELLLPLVFCGFGFMFLSISASARALYLLPLVPALAVLAAHGLRYVPQAFLLRWNLFVRMLGIVATLGIWGIWLLLRCDTALPQLMPYLWRVFPAHFAPQHAQWGNVCLALLAGSVCMAYRGACASLPLRAAQTWFLAVGAVWITLNLLLLPWIDETKSYRPVLARMQDFLTASSLAADCVNTMRLGESIAPMYVYFNRQEPRVIGGMADADCPLVFTVTLKGAPADIAPGWRLVWRGTRALDAKDEELRLYERR